MNKHVAIVGSGQLARMMALDGIPMGLTFSFVAESSEDTVCVQGLGKIVIRGQQTPKELFEALGKPDVITVEKEHVDTQLLTELETFCRVAPHPRALEKFKNRNTEKQFFQSVGVPIANFRCVENKAALIDAIETLEKPVFLKSQEEGYDGYNQYKVTAENKAKIIEEIVFPSRWVAESFVNFEREVSFLAARGTKGEIVFYSAVENYHRNGTLLRSLAPAPNLPKSMLEQGKKHLSHILSSLDYVGLICMECFVVEDQLIVNEIAPRVHNSGHWTSKGSLTSQFENHIRAVCELPLGSTYTSVNSGMLNLLGTTVTADQVSSSNTFLTLYGKKTKPKRKLGHITVIHKNTSDIKASLNLLEDIAYPS